MKDREEEIKKIKKSSRNEIPSEYHHEPRASYQTIPSLKRVKVTSKSLSMAAKENFKIDNGSEYPQKFLDWQNARKKATVSEHSANKKFIKLPTLKR